MKFSKVFMAIVFEYFCLLILFARPFHCQFFLLYKIIWTTEFLILHMVTIWTTEFLILHIQPPCGKSIVPYRKEARLFSQDLISYCDEVLFALLSTVLNVNKAFLLCLSGDNVLYIWEVYSHRKHCVCTDPNSVRRSRVIVLIVGSRSKKLVKITQSHCACEIIEIRVIVLDILLTIAFVVTKTTLTSHKNYFDYRYCFSFLLILLFCNIHL